MDHTGEQAALERVAAEVVAAVERLYREGKSGRVEVQVNPSVRRCEVQTVVKDKESATR